MTQANSTSIHSSLLTGLVSANTPTLLGVGQTWHKRHRPKVHQFAYGVYFLMLPMRALALRAAQAGLSASPLRHNRFGLISFYDADHGVGQGDALVWIDQLLQQQGVNDSAGEVWLQTFPRVLGYVFKPVSFWYVHNRVGDLVAIVAEVNNTFGERHCYLLTDPDVASGAWVVAEKHFHVSPFCQVQGSYQFQFVRQNTSIMARVELVDQGGVLLQTNWFGRLQPLTTKLIWRQWLSQPMMTWGVVIKIHWQALKLALKRVPYFSKPSKPQEFVSR